MMPRSCELPGPSSPCRSEFEDQAAAGSGPRLGGLPDIGVGVRGGVIRQPSWRGDGRFDRISGRACPILTVDRLGLRRAVLEDVETLITRQLEYHRYAGAGIDGVHGGRRIDWSAPRREDGVAAAELGGIPRLIGRTDHKRVLARRTDGEG